MSDWVFRRPPDFRAKPSSLFALLAIASATSGAAAIALTATGTLSGAGALAGTSSIAFDGSATSSGANLSGTADMLMSASATPIAVGQVAGTAALVFDGSGVLTSEAAVPTVMRYRPTKWRQQERWHSTQLDRLVIFPYSQITGIAGQSDIIFTPTGVLRGTGVVVGASSNTLAATGTMRGAGALAGSSAITITPAGAITGTAGGDITGSAAIALSAAGGMGGAGALLGVSANQFTATLISGSVQPMSGVVSLALEATGTLIGGRPTHTPRSRTFFSRGRR